MKRLHLFFSGHVQGVGFRYTAQQVATGFDLLGTVQNLPDGRVEMILEGAESEITEYLKTLEETHLHACIREKEMRWSEAQNNLKGFRILA